jgi:hypothetical protein
MKLLMQFPPDFPYFLPLVPKHSPQHHILNTLSLCSSLNVRNQVWHPHKTTGQITVW